MSLIAFCLSTALSAHAGQPDLIDTARAAGEFDTLLAAIDAAGLTDTLRQPGPFTVFAPTDDAFAALPAGTVEALLQPERRDDLVEVLTYHVAAGALLAAEAAYAKEVDSLAGPSIPLGFLAGQLTAADAPVSATDIQTANGVIHVVDAVLLPPDDAEDDAVQAALVLAIQRGAPLFNQGQPEACAAVYEITAQTLVALGAVSPAQQAVLESALTDATQVHGARERAWVMRRAFDTLLMEMSPAS